VYWHFASTFSIAKSYLCLTLAMDTNHEQTINDCMKRLITSGDVCFSSEMVRFLINCPLYLFDLKKK